ncbi:MAG: biopolymer transporter ExbD [Pseudomonadota bacterium]
MQALHSAAPQPGNSRATRRRGRLRISLTPLIDVVFILLVFFMLASSFLDWRSIRLSAAPSGAPSAGVEGALLVELTADGVRLSGERMDLAALSVRLGERIAAEPRQRVLVRAAPAVDMQRMVRLLDAVAAAGAADIALLPGRT